MDDSFGHMSVKFSDSLKIFALLYDSTMTLALFIGEGIVVDFLIM